MQLPRDFPSCVVGGTVVARCVRSFALSQKGSLFLTRPYLFHYIEQRSALESCADELFNFVASGRVRINVKQRFALKDAAQAHAAL